MTSDLMSQNEAIKYWEERHKSSNILQAGGDKGCSDTANQIFYALRAGKLLELIGRKFNLLSPLKILEAGCGRGLFSDLLSRGGFTVTGIDSSTTAIEYCTDNCLGQYVCSTIDNFTTYELFDVVYSIDVMFHILDDKIWENSLAQLCKMVNSEGLLIITDTYLESRWIRGNYIIHRTHDEYSAVTKKFGMKFIDFHPYAFPGNPIGFYVFEKE
jgi:2-polyprenyl-3-methyl-5-hydroxy-6-metoxy-1,4-benzoquinol methylase